MWFDVVGARSGVRLSDTTFFTVAGLYETRVEGAHSTFQEFSLPSAIHRCSQPGGMSDGCLHFLGTGRSSRRPSAYLANRGRSRPNASASVSHGQPPNPVDW